MSLGICRYIHVSVGAGTCIYKFTEIVKKNDRVM